MVLLKRLLNNLVFHSRTFLSSEECEKHPKEHRALISLGILKQDTYLQERWCPSCESESLPIQIISKKRAYTLCTINEESGRDYFDPQTLKQWRLVTPLFITLFLKALGINEPSITETIAGLLWDLGNHKINGIQYHLFFTREISMIEKEKQHIFIQNTNTVVLYLGTIHTNLHESVSLVPVLEIVNDIKSDGLVIDREVLNSYLLKKILLQKNRVSNSPQKRELRKEINSIIKTGKFGKMEKAFLQYLAEDFERKTIEEISRKVGTKACAKLKGQIQKKLKGTNFNIKTDKGG